MTDPQTRSIVSAARYRRWAKDAQRLAASFDAAADAADRAAFSLLDLHLELTPQEDQPPTSWEVEREQFMRRITEGDE